MLPVFLLPLLYLCAKAGPLPSAGSLAVRQVGPGTLFGPINLPPIQISNISITLFNFGDEVFDISSISVFGDINDAGDCTEADEGAEMPPAGSEVVLGPGNVPRGLQVSNIQVTFFNFVDEVFDISSISIFGDVNDGVCSPS